MKKLLILTEVYRPESFIINSLVDELSKDYQICVLTRCPSYPEGKIFDGFKNKFSKSNENGIIVYRFPIFLNYKKNVIAKIANLLWQPIIYGLIVPFISWDILFVYQTGSLYSYSFLWPLRLTKRKSIIWSQDLWPEAGFMYGFPQTHILETIFSKISKFTLGHFKVLLVQSQDFKKYYEFKYNLYSVVVHNFSNIQKSSDYPNRLNNTSIIYAGNIGSVQNLPGIISLFSILSNSPIPIDTLHIYGDGSKFELLSKTYSDYADIIFHGRVSPTIVRDALSNCRYAIFSLIDGPIQMTIPSRLQFLYDNNVPVIYLGKGAAKDIIEETDSGVTINFLKMDEKMIIQRFLDFESKTIKTPDIFNKNKIVKQIKNLLNN